MVWGGAESWGDKGLERWYGGEEGRGREREEIEIEYIRIYTYLDGRCDGVEMKDRDRFGCVIK